MSTPVREYMTLMPHTVGHDINVGKAKEMMKQYSCHHLPVLDGGTLVGIISDRDIRTVEKLKNSDEIAVEDIMSDEPVTIPATEDVYQVAMLMHQKKIGSVIISASESSPWGIFTATDALAYLSEKHT